MISESKLGDDFALNGKNLSVRYWTWLDCRDLWVWRNDIAARYNSVSTKVISIEEHVAFMLRSLASKQNLSLIADCEKLGKVGSVRFEHMGSNNCDRSVTVSILMNPVMRGQGLARELLRISIYKFLQEMQIPPLFLATIRKDNVASLAVFSKLGFREVRNARDPKFVLLQKDFG